MASAKSDARGAMGAVEVAAILDSVADGVFTVDHDFVITSFNRAAQAITGFSAEEAVGQKCYNIFRATVCQGGCLLRESIETGRPIAGLEITILNRRNEEVPISVSTAVLRDSRGNVVGGVETFRDLTAVEALRREVRQRCTLHELVSKSHSVREIFSLVPDIAASSASVLIQGETGTGKELLARAIHSESPRASGPFVPVNCGALPYTLLESELFGHVAGAFTDARTARKGRFQTADGGTIFLDEIGDMSPAMQVKLLRVLQEHRFEPVGSSDPVSVDVRVIAATHQDLKALVAAGQFRQDLYYRINTVQLSLPTLRQRREDIPLLTEHFLEHFRNLTGKRIRNVNAEAMRVLMTHDWPGNVRELKHAIEHAFVLAKGHSIGPQHLPRELETRSPERPSGIDGRSLLEHSERQVIASILTRHHGNREATARELGISRTTLWRRLRRLGLAS